MSGIERFGEFDDIEMGVLADGTPFLTGAGLAALCGVTPQAISDWGREINDRTPRWRTMTALLRDRGFEGDQIFEVLDDLPKKPNAYYEDVCLSLLEYYGYEAQENRRTEKAKTIFRQFARKTFRDFVYALVGYNQPQLTFSQYTLSRITHHHDVNSNPLPDGYFCLFDKMIEILQKFDLKIGYSLGERWYDTRQDIVRFLEPDISLGQNFSSLFIDDFDDADAKFQDEYTSRVNNPKIKKVWSKSLINLRWRRDRAEAEKQIREKYADLLGQPELDDKGKKVYSINRKRYNFQPAPESNRPPELDAFCYSNEYTSIFYDWLRDVFFKYVWHSYITKRDNTNWLKRYNTFMALPDSKRKSILQTTEGNLIKGFDYREVWEKQLLPEDKSQ